MAAAKKPTAQQKAQAKARAGGNDPIKVTKAGVKRLGQGALIAASLTPVGRGVKVASMAVKAGKAARAASIAQKIAYKEKVTIPAKKVVKAAKAEIKANARGLKAANKPTNKTGSKADRTQRAELLNQSNLIKNASPARPNRVRGGSLRAIKEYGGQGLATVKMSPKRAERQAEITKEMNPVRKKSK